KVNAIAGKAEPGRLKVAGAANPFVIHPNAWQASSWDRNKFALLRSAIQDFKCVKMTYMNAGGVLSDRIVEPISLVLNGPDVRVLEPLHITSILKEKAQRIANLYE
ncbi:MAG: WYL domain-containing protein, partial [Bacilli bacterium]